MGWSIQRLRLSNGLTLPYLEQGHPSGIPVVLLHSYVSTGREFEPLFPHLPSSIHAFALTFRGHGGADRPESGYAVADFGDDVAAFMDAVGLATAVIVGSSSGGYIAQWFAGKYPERTRALVLVGSPRSFRDKAAFVALRDGILTLGDPIDPEFARQFGGEATYPHLPPGYLDDMVLESSRLPAALWKETYLALWDAPVPSTTFRITAPALLLWGDRDHFVTRLEQETLRDAIPGSTLIVYEGIGHIVLWEAPERVARDIVSFVATLSNAE